MPVNTLGPTAMTAQQMSSSQSMRGGFGMVAQGMNGWKKRKASSLPPPSVSYLIVAGGGGGGPPTSGNPSDVQASGAGGGGLLQGTLSPSGLAIGSYSIVIGSGGAVGSFDDQTPAVNGGNSSFNGLTAIGGGKGGSANYHGHQPGGNGGSGGGGSPVGTRVVGQGFAGGGYGGGGGGAGGGPSGATGGVGYTWPGTGLLYAQGGNGMNGPAFTRTANRGDGGGSTAANTFAGAAGVVVIVYVTGSITATGGTVTTSGSNTIHTFTSNGTFQRTA